MISQPPVDRIVVITCPEREAIGPRSTGDDPPGHAAHLWNQRFGSDH
jgi:hypothetical protein